MKLLFQITPIILLLLSACSAKVETSSHDNAIYYWRTTFNLDDDERRFLTEHDINRLYLRYFDVDYDWEKNMPLPIATLQMESDIPDGIEIVPTVYITRSAMNLNEGNERNLAEKILYRINAMSEVYNIPFNEIQLDCDWNGTTRESYFLLCKKVKELLPDDCKLSSTIRLYQLAETPPPVDCGVLMVYNTGPITNYSTDNSIFSAKDVKPYLKGNKLGKYDLPLDVAFPVYGWGVVFDPDNYDTIKFKMLLRSADLSKYPSLKQINKNNYVATENCNIAGAGLSKGDIIRYERGDLNEILEIKDIIASQLRNKPYSIILYHLNAEQLSNYSDDEISEIYTRP